MLAELAVGRPVSGVGHPTGGSNGTLEVFDLPVGCGAGELLGGWIDALEPGA